MKIAMFTNTYCPHVGGVARSVKTYEDEFRRRGHEVLIIAPEFPEADESDEHVLRVPAVQNFNGSDFSMRIATPNLIADRLDEFEPDLIHSHHPFLLGDAAMRAAGGRYLPIVFTHHTLYERFTHYVPFDSPALKRMAIQMATDYCNLCDHVIAPSASVEKLLVQRGVTVPITSIPTGIDPEFFTSGDRQRCRRDLDIPEDALVIGHLGRLALEKNLTWLAEAVGTVLAANPRAVFLVVGDGNARAAMQEILQRHAGPEQVRMAGQKSGQELADAYAAMDLFAFSSQSETQGMVLAEAMIAGLPVVALDGPGVREVVQDGVNGRLLKENATTDEYADAMNELLRDPARLAEFSDAARETAKSFHLEHCASRMLELYEMLIAQEMAERSSDLTPWDRFLGRLEVEWNLLAQKSSVLSAALVDTDATRHTLN